MRSLLNHIRLELADQLIWWAANKLYPTCPPKIALVGALRDHYREEAVEAAAMGSAAWSRMVGR